MYFRESNDTIFVLDLRGPKFSHSTHIIHSIYLHICNDGFSEKYYLLLPHSLAKPHNRIVSSQDKNETFNVLTT